jgi:tetratricopeptide (TPR) repeat protein
MGRGEDARAALARAVSLEADNWRHHFRLALVSWGEARLRSARRTLALLPGLPLAHWLAATVYVARQSLDDAERELVLGIESMDAVKTQGAPMFPGVALEWLLGLIHLSRGDEDGALGRFRNELAQEGQRHLYTRESCANAWYAIGAVHVKRGERDDARAAFRQAVGRVARHPAAVVLAALGEQAALRPDIEVGPSVDNAIGTAIHLAAAGHHDRAAQTMGQALSQAEPGSQVWWLPVEPMLRVVEHVPSWAHVLAQLRSRAA